MYLLGGRYDESLVVGGDLGELGGGASVGRALMLQGGLQLHALLPASLE